MMSRIYLQSFQVNGTSCVFKFYFGSNVVKGEDGRQIGE